MTSVSSLNEGTFELLLVLHGASAIAHSPHQPLSRFLGYALVFSLPASSYSRVKAPSQQPAIETKDRYTQLLQILWLRSAMLLTGFLTLPFHYLRFFQNEDFNNVPGKYGIMKKTLIMMFITNKIICHVHIIRVVATLRFFGWCDLPDGVGNSNP